MRPHVNLVGLPVPGAYSDEVAQSVASREVLGVSIGDSEDAAFWTEFLQSLRGRGLSGVQLVISDSHLGLKAAIAKVFPGASWQRCRLQPAQRARESAPHATVDGRRDGQRSSPSPTQSTSNVR